MLSDPSIRVLLMRSHRVGGARTEMVILNEYLERRGEEISCWMCSDCKPALERSMLLKLALANGLIIGEIPFELRDLTIPEQLLIAHQYPQCYIFKLFPQDYNGCLPSDHLYSGMAGNASLFELNTQEVVEMLKGQRMLMPVASLTSFIIFNLYF